VFVRETADGKQVTKAKSFRTLAQATTWKRKFEDDIKVGTYLAPVNRTLREYATDWLKGRALPPRTLAQYKQKLDSHVLPKLGNYPLQSITLTMIDQLYHDLALKERKVKVGKGKKATTRTKLLSSRSIRYTHAVLRSLLTHAVRSGVMATNPCTYATLPRLEHRESDHMTPDEMNRFLAAAADDPFLCFWVVLADTGARPGEVLALRWRDVRGGRVSISRTAVRHGGEWTFGDTKTKKSTRIVSLPESTIEALRDHKKAAKAAMEMRGQGWDDDALVFAKEDGELPDYRTLIRHHFDKYVKAAGLRKMTPYSMRHGHISALVASGESVRTISDRVGHSSATMTLNTYAHVEQKDREGIAEKWSVIRRA
jgi:integrase